MKKLFLLFISLLSITLFSSCEFDFNDDFVYDFDSKVDEIENYTGKDINEVIDELKDQDLHIESNINGVITMKDYNGSVVYVFYPSSNNKIVETIFEYYTQTPSTALDYYGIWHNSAYDLNYTKYYHGEITYLNNNKHNYSNEFNFIEDFQDYGPDIYNCFEEWDNNYNGCSIEYQVLDLSNRKVSINCYRLYKKSSTNQKRVSK